MSNGKLDGKKFGGLYDWNRVPTKRTNAPKRKSKKK